MKREFNPAISFIRVLAMLSIIAGHLCAVYHINTFQLGAIGVEIFLFISGFLYGNYQTDSWVKWGGYRWKRLIVPMWLTVAIWLIISLIIGYRINWLGLITYGLNIQGINRVFVNLTYPTFLGMGQTWFVIIIITCYVLMVGLKKAKKVENWIDNHSVKSLIVAIVTQIALSFASVQLSYILQFFIGYFISRKTKGKNSWVNIRTFLIMTVFAVILSLLRLKARKYIDGSILYDMILARLSFNALAVWLVMVMTAVGENSPVTNLVQTKGWKLLDLASYPLFLTHYMFLQGPMRFTEWIPYRSMQIILFLIATVGTSLIVFLITENKNPMKLIKAR